MANNWSVWKWNLNGMSFIYISRNVRIFRKFFRRRRETMRIGERMVAESAIIRHVIIRLFVSDDSGIENNWPAQIFEQRTNGLESIPRVCMFANAQSPHCSWVRMPAQHWLLHWSPSLSLSFYLIYDPSNNVHLLFTTPALFTRKIIALVLQTLLSFSLSLSFSIKFSPLQTLPPPVPVFLPVIISCICIYRDRSREKIYTRDDR